MRLPIANPKCHYTIIVEETQVWRTTWEDDGAKNKKGIEEEKNVDSTLDPEACPEVRKKRVRIMEVKKLQINAG